MGEIFSHSVDDDDDDNDDESLSCRLHGLLTFTLFSVAVYLTLSFIFLGSKVLASYYYIISLMFYYIVNIN